MAIIAFRLHNASVRLPKTIRYGCLTLAVSGGTLLAQDVEAQRIYGDAALIETAMRLRTLIEAHDP